MAEEFKKYDSEDKYTCLGVRLAKDVDAKETAGGLMVRLTFVSTSRNEADSDLWIEANVADRQADLAAFLKKGDVLHAVEGKPALRRYGESNEKFSFSLRRASVVVPLGLFAELKARGFTPGAKGAGKVTLPPTSSQPQGRRFPPKRPTMNLDDDSPGF